MKIIKYLFVLFLIVTTINNYVVAQEKSPTPPPTNNTEPIDLPNIFIRGDLQLNVNFGSKQEPEKPMKLTMDMLDSLNSLEKQQSLSIPVEPLPRNALNKDYKNGFINGDFGRFTSANLEGGYCFNLGDYNLFANAGFGTSQGDVANSDYNLAYIKLYSDYIAPAKFLVFGGSRTRTELNYNYKSYKMYALNTSTDRNINNFDVKLDVDGNYSEVRFETGAKFEAIQLTTSSINAANNNILGYLKANKLWNNYYLAGSILLDMNYLRGDGANFYQIDGSASYIDEKFTINVNAGLQLANTTKSDDRGGLLLAGDLEYRLNKLLTIKASLTSGLENSNFAKAYRLNPYISNSANMDFAYNIAMIKGYLNYLPNDKVGLSLGVNFRITDRYPIFKLENDASYSLNYIQINSINAIVEGYWNITYSDRLVCYIEIIKSSLTEFNNKSVPFMPETKISLDYIKSFDNNFGIDFGIDYLGDKYSDIENNDLIKGYVNVRSTINYRLNKELSFYIKLDNLVNQEIVVWKGYKERGLFFNLGAMWQF